MSRPVEALKQVIGERQDLEDHKSMFPETWRLLIGQSVIEDG